MFVSLPAVALLAAFAQVSSPVTERRPDPTPAQKAWQLGQLALERDRFSDAIGHYERGLTLDPRLAQCHLGIAAAHLALGEDQKASDHLRLYLTAHPEHFHVRMPFAEVLERLGELGEAKRQLERFIASVQAQGKLADQQLIRCHTRLMEMAERVGDEYEERLNRGIGLYLLAQKRLELGGEEASRTVEELLCKAAGELTLARMARPAEARPCWYLHVVWHRLGQNQPARRWLRAAGERAGPGTLTPTELLELALVSAEVASERAGSFPGRGGAALRSR